MKRDAAQVIFRTVVFAGAMLGAGAGCSKKQQPTTPPPAPMSGDPATPGPTDPNATPADPAAPADPASDPCAGDERPRGTDDDGGGGTGRGFILS